MKLYLSTIVSLLLSISFINGQSCEQIYKDKLEPSSKLVKCGANFTIEEVENGSHILKRYYPETKQITVFATYKSKEYKELHGRYEEYWDDGTIVNSGMYVNNEKIGKWRNNANQIGFYNQGLRHGEWKTYSKDTVVIGVKNYINGVLHGPQFQYDSLGNTILKETFELGKLVSTTADSTKEYIEVKPRFPGCEDQNLEAAELENCSKKSLLTYIYKNLKYPKKSRKQKIQGQALVQFAIDKDGSVTDINVLNGIAKDIKEEVIRIVKDMPKWKPGQQDGKLVKVMYSLPVQFKLM